MSPSGSEDNRDDLRPEDLDVKEPTSSAKKREEAANEFLNQNENEKQQVQPFEFSEDSKDDENHMSESEESKQEIQYVYDQFPGDVSMISRSKSEDWGGAGYKDYYGEDDPIQPMKLHYTEGDLSNIELVEEDSAEGEESESTNGSPPEGDLEDAFSDRIQIAQ